VGGFGYVILQLQNLSKGEPRQNLLIMLFVLRHSAGGHDVLSITPILAGWRGIWRATVASPGSCHRHANHPLELTKKSDSCGSELPV
jgi:hypothetical protein